MNDSVSTLQVRPQNLGRGLFPAHKILLVSICKKKPRKELNAKHFFSTFAKTRLTQFVELPLLRECELVLAERHRPPWVLPRHFQ